MIINAGVDQMGNETNNDLVLELVREAKVTEERINQAARRILQWHFKLGLFENPYVDPEAAVKTVQSEKNQKLGYQAQLESIVLLVNNGVLPVKENSKIYVEGIEKETAAKYATLVDNPKDADLILVRTTTEEERSFAGFGGGMQGPGNAPGNARNTRRPQTNPQQAMAGMNPFAPREINIEIPKSKWDNIKVLAKTGKPVVVAFNPTGSSCVLPADLKEVTKGTIMIFDALDNALLDVVFGKFNPIGKLAFEIPSSMEAVKKQLEDVPYDSENPAFKFGDGLSYNK